MASTAIEKQSSFSAGEVSPECYGRTDIPSYKQALRLCRNFLPMKHGALKNRAGTKFVATTKNPTGTPPRLIPFVFSDGQTFVLEFGDKYFRVYSNGGAVLNANVVVEVVTPWAIADVPRLKYAQSGDIITICHPSYLPQDVERLSNTSWTVTASLLAPPRWPLQPVFSPSIPNRWIHRAKQGHQSRADGLRVPVPSRQRSGRNQCAQRAVQRPVLLAADHVQRLSQLSARTVCVGTRSVRHRLRPIDHAALHVHGRAEHR